MPEVLEGAEGVGEPALQAGDPGAHLLEPRERDVIERGAEMLVERERPVDPVHAVAREPVAQLVGELRDRLERESLFRYARELGLDVKTFAACLDDPATRARIGEDVEAAARVGVNSTPTLFFNGRTIVGALPERIYYDYALIIEQRAGHAHGPQGAS